jgi:hypothetical protein
MSRTRDGAAAGALAAAAWMAAEPLLQRAFGTPYSDSRLASGFVTRGRLRPLAGLVLHCSAGAAFGSAFARAGGRGWRQGTAAAVLENTVLWPAVALADRVHPDVREGLRPAIARSPRAFASATCGHALFGALLGAFVAAGDERRLRRASRARSG